MSNDSTTRGCLHPIPGFGLDQDTPEVAGLDEGLLDGSIPVNSQNLDRYLQAWIACMLEMDGKLVRPRWQVEPPNTPDFSTNWIAFGVGPRKSDTFAVERHSPNGEGFTETQRHQEMDVLVSCYGPQADGYAEALSDAVQVSQNREALFLQGFGLIEASQITLVPALTKDRWRKRADITVRLRRAITRQFGVLNLTGAGVTLRAQSEQSTRDIEIDVEAQP